MTSGPAVMWDDFHDYQRLCKKYRVKMRGQNHPYESDYRHHDELIERERGTPGKRRKNWSTPSGGDKP